MHFLIGLSCYCLFFKVSLPQTVVMTPSPKKKKNNNNNNNIKKNVFNKQIN